MTLAAAATPRLASTIPPHTTRTLGPLSGRARRLLTGPAESSHCARERGPGSPGKISAKQASQVPSCEFAAAGLCGSDTRSRAASRGHTQGWVSPPPSHDPPTGAFRPWSRSGHRHHQRVVQRFDLRNLCDEVINEDAARLAKRYPALTGDIAIAGDVIEHLTKSEGVDLIEYLQYRFKHIFLVIPVDWVSLEYQDHRYESHIAIWRPADIARFAGSYCI